MHLTGLYPAVCAYAHVYTCIIVYVHVCVNIECMIGFKCCTLRPLSLPVCEDMGSSTSTVLGISLEGLFPTCWS